MSVGLAAILARARDVVRALTPTTDPRARFTLAGADLGPDSEAEAQHRLFFVRPVSEPAALTRALAGPAVGQFRGRFEVIVQFDSQNNRTSGEAAMLEDSEQIVFALETDHAMPAGTRSVEFRGGTTDSEGHFWKRSLTFEATYERTF